MIRKLILIVALLAVLAAAAYGGRKGYRSWQTKNALKQARAAIAKSDLNSALIWTRKAISRDSRNIEAVRLMGDFAEAARLPVALQWRSQLVDLEPNATTNRILLAKLAILNSEPLIAKNALGGVSPEGRKTTEYLGASASLAMVSGQAQEAVTQFEELVRLDPKNPVPQVNLAMILAQRDDPKQSARGLQMLESLQRVPEVRLDALRHLAFDAFRRTNHNRAVSLAAELVREPASTPTDRILHLNMLLAAKSPQLSSWLASYQKESVTNSQRVFEISRWMMSAQRFQQTFDWLHSLPAMTTTNLPVTIVVADSYMGLTNWLGLQGYVSKQYWGDLDYLRLLFLSRALREQGLGAASKSQWSKVIKDAAGQLDRLQAIEGIANNWGWTAEVEEVLWLIVNRYPAAKSAAKALSERLYVQGKTRSLLTLYAQEAKLSPTNTAILNNVAAVALLLNSEQHRPHELARQVYETQKDNPIYVATYAFSLHLQKKNSESIRLMSLLKPEQLERSSIAGYYGLFLASAGDKTKAQPYLEKAAKSLLLPEERELFRRISL